MDKERERLRDKREKGKNFDGDWKGDGEYFGRDDLDELNERGDVVYDYDNRFGWYAYGGYGR